MWLKLSFPFIVALFGILQSVFACIPSLNQEQLHTLVSTSLRENTKMKIVSIGHEGILYHLPHKTYGDLVVKFHYRDNQFGVFLAVSGFHMNVDTFIDDIYNVSWLIQSTDFLITSGRPYPAMHTQFNLHIQHMASLLFPEYVVPILNTITPSHWPNTRLPTYRLNDYKANLGGISYPSLHSLLNDKHSLPVSETDIHSHLMSLPILVSRFVPHTTHIEGTYPDVMNNPAFEINKRYAFYGNHVRTYDALLTRLNIDPKEITSDMKLVLLAHLKASEIVADAGIVTLQIDHNLILTQGTFLYPEVMVDSNLVKLFNYIESKRFENRFLELPKHVLVAYQSNHFPDSELDLSKASGRKRLFRLAQLRLRSSKGSLQNLVMDKFIKEVKKELVFVSHEHKTIEHIDETVLSKTLSDYASALGMRDVLLLSDVLLSENSFFNEMNFYEGKTLLHELYVCNLKKKNNSKIKSKILSLFHTIPLNNKKIKYSPGDGHHTKLKYFTLVAVQRFYSMHNRLPRTEVEFQSVVPEIVFDRVLGLNAFKDKGIFLGYEDFEKTFNDFSDTTWPTFQGIVLENFRRMVKNLP